MKKNAETKKVRTSKKRTAAEDSPTEYITLEELFEHMKGHVLGKLPKPPIAKPEAVEKANS
jgi:hypothetical protein